VVVVAFVDDDDDDDDDVDTVVDDGGDDAVDILQPCEASVRTAVVADGDGDDGDGDDDDDGEVTSGTVVVVAEEAKDAATRKNLANSEDDTLDTRD